MIARRVCFLLGMCFAANGIVAQDTSAADATLESVTEYLKIPADFKGSLLDKRDDSGRIIRISARVPLVAAYSNKSIWITDAKLVAMEQEDGTPGVVARDFTVRFDNVGTASRYAYLVFATSKIRAVRPGDYRFVVHLKYREEEAGQAISVLLKRAAPVIGVGETVVIRQSSPLFGLPTTFAGELRVREDAGSVDLRNVRVLAFPDQPNTRQTSARVTFNGAVFDVARGSSVARTPMIEGEFPLGASKGKIEVSSADLAQISSVPYEVRVSRSEFLIVVCIALGLLFGVIVRGAITRLREGASATFELSKVAGAGNEFRSRIRDAKFRDRIDEILFTLVPMATAKDTEALAKLGKEKLDALRVEFQEKLASTEKSFLELDQFLGLPWDLPTAAQEAIMRARRRLVSALELLEMQDLHSCEKMQADIIRNEVTPAVNAASAWHLHLVDYFNALNTNPPPLFAADRIQLENVSRDLSGARPATPVVTATPAIAQPILDAARARWVMRDKLFDWLARGLLEFADHGIQALNPPPNLQTKSAALRKRAIDMADRVKEDVNSGDPTRNPRSMTEAARRAWLEIVVALGRGDAIRDKFKELLDAGKWEAAIEAARVPLDMPVESAGALATLSAPPLPREELVLLPEPMGRGSGAREIALQGTREEQKSILRRIFGLDLARGAILALILLGTALLYYGENWVGTDKDLAALFLLALSTDLTADGLAKFFKI